MKQLDDKQRINQLKYTCKECGSFWNTKEFLKTFEENYTDYDGYVKSDWSQIIRYSIENVFRPEDSMVSIVCPFCSLRTDGCGDIKVIHQGYQNKQELSDVLKDMHEHHLERAISGAKRMPNSVFNKDVGDSQ